MAVLIDSIISRTPCRSTARSGKFYQEWSLSDTDFSKALFLQEVSDNSSSEMSAFAERQAAYVDALALSKTFRAKPVDYVLTIQAVKSEKGRDLLFTTQRYRFLLSRHVHSMT